MQEQCQKLGLNVVYSCHANVFANLNKKNFTSPTPLNGLRKSFTFALNQNDMILGFTWICTFK